MPLYWLVYRHNNQVCVVIEPAPSLIHARLRASLAGLDEGEFTEGHELDRKWRVPKAIIGRRLSQAHANLLRRGPAPTTLNRRDDLNAIGRIGHRHGCMPHTC
jgi:hypothetical protein